jgi:hypothetical protein
MQKIGLKEIEIRHSKIIPFTKTKMAERFQFSPFENSSKSS